MAARYRKKARAEKEQRTRMRIVEAAVDLHERVGPDRTSMADVAAHAGVGKATVYRHFAGLADLAGACSSLYFERHPPPDPAAWRSVSDPDAQLRTALREAFAYHRSTAPMLTRVLAVRRDDPDLDGYHAHWRGAVDVLVAGRGLRGRRGKLVRAGITHAISFDCWRALTEDQELSDTDAVEVATRLAGDADLTKA